MPNNIRGIENGRANAAFECAKLNLTRYSPDEFKSHVKSIPMMIKTNGLGATFAFMLSKKKDYEAIGNCILNWLKEDSKKIINLDSIEKNQFKDFVQKLTTLSSAEYRALTNEVLSYLNWLRRFADGLAEDK